MRISLSHSTLGKQRDWKWQGLIKKSPSWGEREKPANWILQRERHQGLQEGGKGERGERSRRETRQSIADLPPFLTNSQSSFRRTMWRDGPRVTRGGWRAGTKKDTLCSLLRPWENVESAVRGHYAIGEGAESTLPFVGGGGGGEGAQLCFWRRTASCVRSRGLIGYLWRALAITIRPLRLRCWR